MLVKNTIGQDLFLQ